MNWEVFECDDCKLQYAIKQKPGDEIEEPSCPGCGSSYFRTVEQPEERSPIDYFIFLNTNAR